MDAKLYIDFNRNGAYDHPLSDVSNRVRDRLSWTLGFTSPTQVESNPSLHVSPVAQLSFTLDNRDSALAFENVGAEFYNMMQSGLQVKLEFTLDGITHYFLYYAREMVETPGEFGAQLVNVACECVMPRVQKLNYEPDVEQNVRTDVAITTMLETGMLMLPYTGSFFIIDATEIDSDTPIFDPTTDVAAITDFEAGFTTMDYVGDVIRRDQKDLANQKGLPFLYDVCMAEAFGRFYYQPRDGSFHFHNRYHDKLVATSVTLTALDYIRADSMTTPVYNDVRVHYMPRKVGEPNTILFDSDQVPIDLAVNAQKTLRVRYVDNNNEDASIAALVVDDFELGADIIIEDEDGNDISENITISSDLSGTGGQVIFTNQTGDATTIETLRVKGTPITMYQSQISTAVDAVSLATYNWQQLPDVRANYIFDDDFAQEVANFLLLRHKTMRRVFRSVTVQITDENFIDFAGVTIGDVIVVQEAWSGHNSEYVVLGEWHQYSIADHVYTITWYLRQNSTTPYFIIDSSEIDGPDIIGY